MKKFSLKKLLVDLIVIAIILSIISFFKIGHVNTYKSSSFEQEFINIQVKLMYELSSVDSIEENRISSWLMENVISENKLLKLVEEIDRKENKLSDEKYVIYGIVLDK